MLLSVLWGLCNSLLFPHRVKSSTFIPSTAPTTQGMAWKGVEFFSLSCGLESLDAALGTVCLALCWKDHGKCKTAENGLWGSQILFDAFWTGRIRRPGAGKIHERHWIRPGASLHSSKGKLINLCCCIGLSTFLLAFSYVCHNLCITAGEKMCSGFAW